MAGMDIVCERFVMGDVPRFSAETKILDRKEEAFREVLLVEKHGKKYIIAIKYMGFGDDGGFAAMVWEAETVRKYKATEEDLFKAIDEAVHLTIEGL